MCISKEKAVHHYVDLIVKVFEENYPGERGGCWMPIKDVQEWGVLSLDQH